MARSNATVTRTEFDALVSAVAGLTASVNTLVAAQAKADEPAKVTRTRKPQPKAEEPNEFVTWLRDTAEARAARKADNKALSAMLDEKRKGWRGAANRDAIWAAAKAGKRIPAVKAA